MKFVGGTKAREKNVRDHSVALPWLETRMVCRAGAIIQNYKRHKMCNNTSKVQRKK